MKEKIKIVALSVMDLLLVHRLAGAVVVVVGVVFVAAALIGSYAMIAPNKKFVLDAQSLAGGKQAHGNIGIVLGAGVNAKGKPYKELEARLNVAADALDKGYVDKLILSGDNRFVDYNEPEAMKEYLINIKHIDAQKLQPDYAGRSTYESCDRAANVFGLHKAVIFSAGSHLPRAIFLCRHFGIEAYGVSSGVEANNSTRRELLARVKAVYNIYVRGEHTVLGAPILVEQ
jgi:vancomycin permeability regulator SanA